MPNNCGKQTPLMSLARISTTSHMVLLKTFKVFVLVSFLTVFLFLINSFMVIQNVFTLVDLIPWVLNRRFIKHQLQKHWIFGPHYLTFLKKHGFPIFWTSLNVLGYESWVTSVADKSDPKFYAIIDKKTEKATGVVSYEVMISHTKKLLTVF